MPCILLLTAPPRHSKYCIAPSDELLSLKRTKGVKPDAVPNTGKRAPGGVVPIPTAPVVSLMTRSPSVSEIIQLAILFGVPVPEVSGWTDSPESLACAESPGLLLLPDVFGLTIRK